MRLSTARAPPVADNVELAHRPGGRVDDRVDPEAASAASAGSVAAQPDTVVRKRVEPKPESDNKNGDTPDGKDKSSDLTAAEALGGSSKSADGPERPEKARSESSDSGDSNSDKSNSGKSSASGSTP